MTKNLSLVICNLYGISTIWKKPDIQEATTHGQSAQHPALPLLGGWQPYTQQSKK